MGTNYAPLVAGLFLFCFVRDFMLSLPEDNQSDVIKAVNSTSRYLDDLLTLTITSLIAWSTVSTFQNFSEIRPTCQRYRGLVFGFAFIYIAWCGHIQNV